ncbi:hypothetical protein LIPSTDRAFT_162380 [Lipomyces starkeyi NRRL Y-11557]|uniref:Uncharacterized protein n=1 Tax=Lipomyces starkeyi NRRL Y-11557 TaxID=675824 RepID=A0A1E3Q091_LIPST|nr:hypothetical protein LIPSTDRAFT_162380 [Lipomyces starkeyi NRRL Y-11557]
MVYINRIRTHVRSLVLADIPAIQCFALYSYVFSLPMNLPVKTMQHRGPLTSDGSSRKKDRRPWQAVFFLKLMLLLLKDCPHSVFTPDEMSHASGFPDF